MMKSYEEILTTYNLTFKEFVENPDGTLNRDAVMRELYDYSIVAEQATKVYWNVTNGRVGNVFTKPEVIIAIAEDCIAELIENEIAEYKLNHNCTCAE